MNRKIPDYAVRDLAESWDRASAGDRSRKVREIADTYKAPATTVYRRIKELRDHGCRTVKRKSCKGEPRVFPREQLKIYIKAIMGIKAHDPTKPDKKLSNANKSMSTARAIEIAENMGLIPKGKLTVRTVNRWAREFNITAKNICSPRPAVKIITEHPNHMHEVDCSVCDQYYLDDKGELGEKDYVYKNKPNESREKIWLVSIVDHYSNVKFFKYYLSPGESSEILIDCLIEAWSLKLLDNGKPDTNFPFHGIPRAVYGDKGSALMSQMTQNFLASVGVEIFTHKPGNPRAKGMVESGFNHIQRDLESGLRYRPATMIDELNTIGHEWQLQYNWRKKAGEKKPRFQKWLEITKEQLRVLPSKDILRKITASDVIRTVDAYCNISLNNEIHGVPPEIAGKKVRVWTNIDGGISVQDMETGKMYPTAAPKTAVFGTFNAYKKTEAERMQDDAIRMVDELRKSRKFTPEVLRRNVPKIHAVPRTGVPVEVDSDLYQEEREEYGNAYEAQVAIMDELRINLCDLPEWMLEKINETLAKTLNKKKVHKIARLIEEYLRETRNAV